VYLELEQRLRYADAWPQLVVEDPPRPELGDFALPFLLRAGQAVAASTAADRDQDRHRLHAARGSCAGGGGPRRVLELFVDRGWAWSTVGRPSPAQLHHKVLVEHANSTPNKTDHIVNLRDAVLGDTWVRLLRRRGETVEVQSPQDSTGYELHPDDTRCQTPPDGWAGRR